MLTTEALAARHIPFTELRYSTEAFIDYCIPECKPKFNYALIGPGVSQNPKQPINLREPHGFQVGGVSIPHGKINPAHMHFTCEVFMCVRGSWRIRWGFNPEELHADIGAGDIVSVPTWIYRGFTNVGVDDGFMFTALGGDHTGGILWGPTTLAAAQAQGVYLTEDYRIVDTTRGDRLGPDTPLLQPMTPEEIGALRRWSPEAMARRIVRFADLQWAEHSLLDAALPGRGGQIAPVIGYGMVEDRDAQAPVVNPHGLSIEWLRLPAGGGVARHRLVEKQVLIVKQGRLELTIEGADGILQRELVGADAAWDTFAIPDGHWRRLRQVGEAPALALLLTSGDHRKRIEWSAEVLEAALARGLARDANGCIAPRQLVERAQR